MSKLTALLGSLKANILEVVHERSEMSTRLDETGVQLTLETRGPEHSEEVIAGLKENGNSVTILK